MLEEPLLGVLVLRLHYHLSQKDVLAISIYANGK
jgi:hypothetical protein